FTDLLPPALLPDGEILSIFHASRNELLLGSDDFIYLLRPKEIHLLKSRSGWSTAFLRDSTGKIWVGGEHGLDVYGRGKLTPVELGLKDLQISALLEDRRHQIWLGTNQGLYKLGRDGLSLEAPVFGSTLGKVNALLEDRNGNLWAATEASGVFRVSAEGGNPSFYSAEDGLN